MKISMLIMLDNVVWTPPWLFFSSETVTTSMDSGKPSPATKWNEAMFYFEPFCCGKKGLQANLVHLSFKDFQEEEEHHKAALQL